MINWLQENKKDAIAKINENREHIIYSVQYKGFIQIIIFIIFILLMKGYVDKIEFDNILA